MKSAALLMLFLAPLGAEARTLNFTCTLSEHLGGVDPVSTGSVGWSISGFERPDGLIELEADGLKARINVIRDTLHSQGFFYRLHLLDESNGKTFDVEFMNSTGMRPRVEGNVSIQCDIDA